MTTQGPGLEPYAPPASPAPTLSTHTTGSDPPWEDPGLSEPQKWRCVVERGGRVACPSASPHSIPSPGLLEVL